MMIHLNSLKKYSYIVQYGRFILRALLYKVAVLVAIV